MKIKKNSNELPSAFTERLFSSMYSSQMDTASPVARALVRIINLLRSDLLDKSVTTTPLDTNKKIFCFTDAAVTCGMAYLLLLKKQVSDEDRDPEHGYLIIS